jgi:Flp pilus assembly protein protease CpaA
MSYATIHLAILGTLCLAAAVWDLARRRIPNLITAPVLAAGLWAQASTAGATPALSGVGAAAVVLVALYPLWSRGGIGGGDVKFAVAAAVWVGLGRLPVYLLAGAIAGGVVAGVCYLLSPAEARGVIRENLWTAAVLRQIPDAGATRKGVGRVRVPYALAIVAGLCAALWMTWRPHL